MIVVIIPVFNEEKNISYVIDSVLTYCDKIIVVNDASTDSTQNILEQYINEKLVIIKNPKNLGIGGATKIGITKALELNAEYIIKFDGDGQHSSQDIPKFINYLKRENFDYVKGNRFKSSISDMPFVKLLGNLISTNLQKIVTGNFRISDPNNGFIAFKANIFEKINLKYLRNDYFFENSFLLNLIVYKFKIAEHPIKTIYASEKSSIPLFFGSIKLFPVFLKLLYLKNYLNIKINLSMGSSIFVLLNIAIGTKFINNEIVSINQIFLLAGLYYLIEVINFLND